MSGRSGLALRPVFALYSFVMFAGTVMRLPRSPDHAIRATVSHMRRLANAAQCDPRVVMAARLVCASVTERDLPRQIAAINGFVRDAWSFVEDPWDVELLQSPAESLQCLAQYGTIMGDCDDAAVLCAALGKCVGFPARYVVLAWGDPTEPYSHVYTELANGPSWCPLDVTKPRTLTRLPRIGRFATFEV